jgi:hypothetical protein
MPQTRKELPLYERSKFWRFFVEAGYTYDMLWVAVLGVGGIGALVFAIFALNGVAFALALVALPLAFIMWCIAKGGRDVGRDE